MRNEIYFTYTTGSSQQQSVTPNYSIAIRRCHNLTYMEFMQKLYPVKIKNLNTKTKI